MRYRKPEELKDSDLEWSGDIPYGWDTTKLKFQTIVNMGQSPPSDGYNKKGIGTPFLQGNADFTDKYPQTESFTDNGNKFSQKEDILFSIRAPVGEINIADKEYCIGRGLCSISPRNVNSRFLWHYLHIARKELKAISTGSTFESVSSDDVKNLSLLLPPKTEQRSIANFLDRKTEAIDDLIQKKEQLIERLKEKRQALITQAVTKGLDPDVPMKDSGIEWIGKMPEHWELTRLKWLLKDSLQYGANESSDQDDPDNPRYIRITDFDEDGKLRSDTFRSLPKKQAEGYYLNDGDILFARSGATVGKTFQFKNYDGQACYAGYLIKARPDNKQITSDFMYLFTKSQAYECWKNSIFIQATIQNISAEKYGNLLIPLPSLSEQKKIVGILNNKIAQILKLEKVLSEEIDKLKEYRQSLISAAVTGKIDVRDEVEVETKEVMA